LRLLVDECAGAAPLVGMLRKAGHDVVLSVEVLGAGATDRNVLGRAKTERRVILTFDCADFAVLHADDRGHTGILVAYQDGDSRDMGYGEVASSIARIEHANPGGIAGRIIVLKHHRGAR
jgi:hypothetical protein